MPTLDGVTFTCVLDAAGNMLHECAANHQTRPAIRFAKAAVTRALHIEVLETHGASASLFEVRCYENEIS